MQISHEKQNTMLRTVAVRYVKDSSPPFSTATNSQDGPRFGNPGFSLSLSLSLFLTSLSLLSALAILACLCRGRKGSRDAGACISPSGSVRHDIVWVLRCLGTSNDKHRWFRSMPPGYLRITVVSRVLAEPHIPWQKGCSEGSRVPGGSLCSGA